MVKKNILNTGAIKFKSPIKTAAIATAKVTKVPILGSSLSPLPCPKNRIQGGKIPSLAKAWRMRGAPNILPIALLRVAPQTPKEIAGPQTAIFSMMKGSSIKVPPLARVAKKRGKVR